MVPGAAVVGLTIREAAPVVHASAAAFVTGGCEPRIADGQIELTGGPPAGEETAWNAFQANAAASTSATTATSPVTSRSRFHRIALMPHNRVMVADSGGIVERHSDVKLLGG